MNYELMIAPLQFTHAKLSHHSARAIQRLQRYHNRGCILEEL